MKIIKKIAFALAMVACVAFSSCSLLQTACKHTDTVADHYCDICSTKISSCIDTVADDQCDICGASLTTIDYAAITNTITKEYMRGIVTVRSQYLEMDGYWYGQTSSGVVYDCDETNGVYYILTNNHALERYYEPSPTAFQTKVMVVDSYGYEYEAAVACRDAAYDLAVVAISKTIKSNFTVFEMATVNPEVGQKIAVLGNPAGQKNAITYGEVTGYDTCNLSTDYSRVEFSCVKHTAWMSQGSSGGVLMSLDYKVFGINFAVTAHPMTGEFMAGWSVPVEAVKEFLVANENWFA